MGFAGCRALPISCVPPARTPHAACMLYQPLQCTLHPAVLRYMHTHRQARMMRRYGALPAPHSCVRSPLCVKWQQHPDGWQDWPGWARLQPKPSTLTAKERFHAQLRPAATNPSNPSNPASWQMVHYTLLGAERVCVWLQAPLRASPAAPAASAGGRSDDRVCCCCHARPQVGALLAHGAGDGGACRAGGEAGGMAEGVQRWLAAGPSGQVPAGPASRAAKQTTACTSAAARSPFISPLVFTITPALSSK